MNIKTTFKDLIRFVVAATLITGTLVGCGAAAMPKKEAPVSKIHVAEVDVVKAAAPAVKVAEATVAGQTEAAQSTALTATVMDFEDYE